jgi:multiple sugar transport system ATP-binding protein
MRGRPVAEVRLDNVTLRFGRVTAVDALSLGVADGEFFVLLGPTGAGKTSTLRVAAGLEQPQAGTVSIGGRDVTRLAPALRDVAFVFQQYSLYPHYTVFDNMAFPLRSPVRRVPEDKIRRRVEDVARVLRIDHKLKNKAVNLSGGEMQRVSLGRALVRSPVLFLMDEPLSSLDAKLREELRIELKHIQIDLGATLLYVTHDQVEALALADRIGVLERGRLVQVGTPRAVYSDPETVFVAQQLGSPQINLIPAALFGAAGTQGQALTVGVRPENLVLGRGGLAARVAAVEHLGVEDVVLAEVGEQALRVLVPGASGHRVGQEVTVDVAADGALLFDAAGRRRRDVTLQQLVPAERARHAV